MTGGGNLGTISTPRICGFMPRSIIEHRNPPKIFFRETVKNKFFVNIDTEGVSPKSNIIILDENDNPVRIIKVRNKKPILKLNFSDLPAGKSKILWRRKNNDGSYEIAMKEIAKPFSPVYPIWVKIRNSSKAVSLQVSVNEDKEEGYISSGHSPHEEMTQTSTGSAGSSVHRCTPTQSMGAR